MEKQCAAEDAPERSALVKADENIDVGGRMRENWMTE